MPEYKIETIKSAELFEQYKSTVLPSGLTVLCCEKPDRRGIYAVYATAFGATVRDYTVGSKKYTLPAGTAHYLEHKMFAGKKGDAFELFAKTGANANAFTSHERTCYVFGANENIEESLRILLEFVSTPYFTKRNVDKERGIIAQELQMYLDNPDSRLLNETLNLLYHSHPLREDIGGTVESIADITPELLYGAYNAFYHPKNMVLAVAGNITNERLLELCAKYLPESAESEPGVPIWSEEPESVVSNNGHRQMSVSSRQFCLGYKEKPQTGNRLRNEIIFDLVSELVAGESSDFYNRLYDDGLINGSFYSESLMGKGYFTNLFGGESSDPQEVVRRLNQRISELKANGVDQERLNEARLAAYGDAVMSLDSNGDLALALAFSHLKGYCIYDALGIINSITKQDIDAALAAAYSPERSALYIIDSLERT